jgi:hypothetical protein
MKAVLCSRNAVLAAVIVEPITLDTEAGEDATPPKFGTLELEGITQFCACAPEAANSGTANAIPRAAAVQRPRQREFLPNPLGV